MYTTRLLSEFRANPLATQQRPHEAPGSGYLVVQEGETEDMDTCCTGCTAPRVRDLPFPQNKILTIRYRTGGKNSTTYTEKVLFVPVMNQPLSMNRYYVVVAKGKHKKEIFTSSREEDMTTCCFGNCINDTKPSPFDHRDIYQQFEIIPHKGRFTAKSVASDGFVPWIFRQKYWALYDETSKSYQLNEALGINTALRSHLPEIEVAVSRTIGKWYCPFFFVKERKTLKEKMESFVFYQVTLEQFWEQVHNGMEKKRILYEGKGVMQQEGLSDGFMWFKERGDLNGERIGLSSALWESVKWEENRGGWIEESGAMDLEVKFESFVLVERFLFKRMDGSLAFALDFMHKNKVITK
ncbi:hypothetical protein LUZ60_003233 [Juncus effusus]|nr:hypothetical protein LUZ60_003233 [Juncus effusus]